MYPSNTYSCYEPAYILVVGATRDDDYVYTLTTPIHLYEIPLLPKPVLTIDNLEHNLTYEAGSLALGYTVEHAIEGVEVSVSKVPEWVSVELDDKNIYITYEENPHASARAAKITFSYSGADEARTVVLTQEANPTAEVYTFELSVVESHYDHVIVNVTPSNENVKYALKGVSKSDFEGYSYGGSDLALQESDLSSSYYKPTFLTGTQENYKLSVGATSSNLEWYIYVYAVSEDETPAVIPNNGIGEDGVIALNQAYTSYYLGDVWDTGVADYYLILSNDELGQNAATGFEVPLHQGGWILYLDLWSTISQDTANAVLPEGTYTFGHGRDMWCFYDEFSLATNNYEQVKTDEGWRYRIKDIFFKSGTVEVAHVEAGYLITAEVTTTSGEILSFRYEGPVAFEDQSDDEEWRVSIDEDVDVKAVYGTVNHYSSYEDSNCDNYVVQLFNVTELTSDKMHPNVAGGMKLMLDIYPELGKGIAGTYEIGTLSDEKYLLKKEPWVYYPGCYWGTIALGTFLELVEEDGTVLYSVVKSGTLTITDNADGTNTIVADFVTERGKKLTCNWTGTLVEF